MIIVPHLKHSAHTGQQVLQHFAGPVGYSAETFFEKNNMDELPHDANMLMPPRKERENVVTRM